MRYAEEEDGHEDVDDVHDGWCRQEGLMLMIPRFRPGFPWDGGGKRERRVEVKIDKKNFFYCMYLYKARDGFCLCNPMVWQDIITRANIYFYKFYLPVLYTNRRFV